MPDAGAAGEYDASLRPGELQARNEFRAPSYGRRSFGFSTSVAWTRSIFLPCPRRRERRGMSGAWPARHR